MVVLAKTREDANVKRNNDDDGDNAALTRGRGARDLDPRPADKQESARALFVRCTAPETAQSSGNARASAYIEVGGENRLMGVVHGPRRGQGGASSSTLRVELTYAPFSGGGGTSAREQEISSRVHDVVGAAVLASELAEKGLVVDLHVLVMSSGGGDLAHAITCASLALANALVPMRDVITAAHVVRNTRQSGRLGTARWSAQRLTVVVTLVLVDVDVGVTYAVVVMMNAPGSACRPPCT